jgi:hypothetical protein
MIKVQSIFRASADRPDGTTVEATGMVILLPDPEAADLVAGGSSTAVGEAVADALTAAVADGSLVLPS